MTDDAAAAEELGSNFKPADTKLTTLEADYTTVPQLISMSTMFCAECTNNHACCRVTVLKTHQT